MARPNFQDTVKLSYKRSIGVRTSSFRAQSYIPRNRLIREIKELLRTNNLEFIIVELRSSDPILRELLREISDSNTVKLDGSKRIIVTFLPPRDGRFEDTVLPQDDGNGGRPIILSIKDPRFVPQRVGP